MQGQSVELCSWAGPQRDGIGLEEPGREMSDFRALRRIFLPDPTSPKEPRRTRNRSRTSLRARHFRGLSTPLTNFSGRNSRDALELRRLSDQDGGRRLSRCVLGVDEP
jgi:hypothetical protein